MHVNVAKELAALEAMTVAELRAKYAQVFGEETRVGNKAWLVKRIIWRLQALAEGDLSERARRRAAELAQDADLRLSPPRAAQGSSVPGSRNGKANHRNLADRYLPLPGTILTRWYKGQALQVQVQRQGFEYEGRVYKSLSAVAKAITGSHTSGHLFFRQALAGRGGSA
jgi:Protein of unknown function (DUF2924)